MPRSSGSSGLAPTRKRYGTKQTMTYCIEVGVVLADEADSVERWPLVQAHALEVWL